MRAYEAALVRIWPTAHSLGLGGVLGMAVMTLPGMRLDFWSADDARARIKLHEAVLGDLPDNRLTRPARADLLFGLGVLCTQTHDYAQAVGWSEKALRESEKLRRRADIAHCQFQLGRLYYTLGRPEEALNLFRRGLEVSPRYRGAHTWLGNALAALGRYDEALAAYQEATDLYPQDAGPHVGVGHIYTQMGRLSDAAVAYQWATEAAPDDDFVWRCLGRALHRLKRFGEAEAAYRRALELSPDEPETCELLGNLAASQSDYAQALAWYQRAAEKQADAPQQARLRVGVGKVQQLMRQYGEAMESFRQALRADPNFMPAHLELGACLRKLGRQAEAAEPLQTART